MKRISVFFIISLLFFSCASSIVEMGDAISRSRSVPELNTVTTVSIGDVMLLQATETKTSAVQILKTDPKLHCTKGYYKLWGNDGKGVKLYAPIISTGASFSFDPLYGQARWFAYGERTVTDSTSGQSEKKVVLSLAGLGGYGNLFRYQNIPEDFYKFTEVTLEGADNFQQTLIYTGREKNIVKFTYREFKDNFARPDFTIDVQYDLSMSKDISFKNARIEIIDATNNSITYKVLKNFN